MQLKNQSNCYLWQHMTTCKNNTCQAQFSTKKFSVDAEIIVENMLHGQSNSVRHGHFQSWTLNTATAKPINTSNWHTSWAVFAASWSLSDAYLSHPSVGSRKSPSLLWSVVPGFDCTVSAMLENEMQSTRFHRKTTRSSIPSCASRWGHFRFMYFGARFLYNVPHLYVFVS